MALRATVELFNTEECGRTLPISRGFRCISILSRDPSPPVEGFAVMPLLGEPLAPGETRELDLLFLTDEGEQAMQRAGTFYLWDGRVFGKVTVTSGPIVKGYRIDAGV